MGASAMNTSPAETGGAMAEIMRLLQAEGFLPAQEGTRGATDNSFRIVSADQDYGRPVKDLCCHTFSPLCIGRETFKKGIGAHSNGRIVIDLLRPAKSFSAYVGIDNNADTQGARGTAQFVVLTDGKERFQSPVCRSGQEAIKIDVDLTGVKRLELIVKDGGDGIAYDQSDWAEASLLMQDGHSLYVGDALASHLFASIPASFDYDGRNCWGLFKDWPHEVATPETVSGGTRYATTWHEPDTGFSATLSISVFDQGPAMELQWRFENRGTAPSRLITNIRSIDFHCPATDGQTTLTSCSGGLTGNLAGQNERTGFELCRTPLGEKVLTVTGGRSSNGDLPFYILTNLESGWGLATALGWSGQWRAHAGFRPQAKEIAFEAGIAPAHFALPAGETVLLPTALFVPFEGDVPVGANALRHVLRSHYQARLDGQPVLPPVSFNSWFVFDNRVNEKMLKELAAEAAPLGIEYFCLDAGWFDGDFPNGVGNWTINKDKFPNGLKPLADHVHALGMKFGLWFEPERVADGTRWQKEHPDLLLKNNLIDLGNQKARDLVLSMMDSIITEVGVDWIRYDFNIDPLDAWAQNEAEEEQGLRQIRYINGLYLLLDELMRRHPDLLIEQCSSGGRRIDIETIRRGHTYWKSDDTMDQSLMRFHETGANYFLLGGHLNTNYCHYRNQAELLALCAGPLGFGADFRALSEEQKQAIKQTVDAYKTIRPFLNQDYYPLFEQSKSSNDWCGWQFVDPATQEGFLLVYRPVPSPYDAASVRLRGLDDARQYQIRELITGSELIKSGAELSAGLPLTLGKDTAQIWRFRPA